MAPYGHKSPTQRRLCAGARQKSSIQDRMSKTGTSDSFGGVSTSLIAELAPQQHSFDALPDVVHRCRSEAVRTVQADLGRDKSRVSEDALLDPEHHIEPGRGRHAGDVQVIVEAYD